MMSEELESKITVSSDAVRNPKCELCGTTGTITKRLKICGSCQRVYYCTKECQKQHWKQHKILCLNNK